MNYRIMDDVTSATEKLKRGLLDGLLPRSKTEQLINRIICLGIGHGRSFCGYCVDCGKKI